MVGKIIKQITIDKEEIKTMIERKNAIKITDIRIGRNKIVCLFE